MNAWLSFGAARIRRILVAVLIGAVSQSVVAAEPSGRPIRLIQSYPAGGASDFVARTIAGSISASTGQSMYVDNKPGAGGLIAGDLAARAAADGYTLWQGDIGALIFNPVIYKKVPYKLSDFSSVGLVARFNLLLVASNTSGVNTAREAIDLMKKSPGKFNYASVGVGSPHHFAFELFKGVAGVDLVHVPYRGQAAAVQDLTAGVVPFMFIDTFVAIPQAKAGSLKVLAVAAARRLPQFPDVPTFAELGFKEVEVYAWQALVAPAKTPRPVVERLNRNLRTALANPEVARKLTDIGLELLPGSPEEMDAYVASQVRSWGAVLKAVNLQLEP